MLLRCYRDGDDGRVVGPDGSRDWFATGDAGRLDCEGKLVVSGRIADVITTGAEKVWPDAVERILMAHPGVAEVAVWKRPDPEWGERVVAWVVPTDDGPSLDELRQMVTDEHRSLGGPEGAGPRRRPSPHRGGQGPAAGARAPSSNPPQGVSDEGQAQTLW